MATPVAELKSYRIAAYQRTPARAAKGKPEAERAECLCTGIARSTPRLGTWAMSAEVGREISSK